MSTDVRTVAYGGLDASINRALGRVRTPLAAGAIHVTRGMRTATMPMPSKILERIADRALGPFRARILKILKSAEVRRRATEMMRRPPSSMNSGVILLPDGTPCIVYDHELPWVTGVEIGIDGRIRLDCVDLRTRQPSNILLEKPLSMDALQALRGFKDIGIGRVDGDKATGLHKVRATFEENEWETLHPVPIGTIVRSTTRVLAWAVLFLVALLHVVKNRPLSDWHYLVGGIALIEAYGLFVWVRAIRRERGPARKWLDKLGAITRFTFITLGAISTTMPLSIVVGIFFYVMLATAKDLALSALAFAPIQGTIAVLAIAFGLFLFRLRLRATYGATEIYAGLYIYVQQLESRSPDFLLHARHFDVGVVAALASGVYLVVRGMDNFHQGMSKDPLLKWLRGRW